MTDRTRRLRTISELLQNGSVHNQEQLSRLLGDQGLAAAQATISRDLRDLGVLKGPSGYRLPDPDSSPDAARATLAEALRAYVTRMDRGGSLVVVRTGPGQSQVVALEIDRARLPGAIGTVAGDDTIFVATRDDRAARAVLAVLQRLAGISKGGQR